MDQMKKATDEMKGNMRRENPIDDLVHRTDSPFMASINSHPLPPKFKMPSLDSYDRTRDPLIILLPLRLQCTFKGFQMKLCVRSFLPPLKGQHECSSTRYL